MTMLSRRTWPEAGQWTGPATLVPLGSVEQHGPHLPLDTDTRIAVAVASRYAARRPGLLVAPALAYGASGEHETFPGTVSLGTAATAHALVELVRSLSRWCPRTVFVIGHGGNADAVRTAVATLASEGRPVLPWYAAVPGGDAHAGRTETSLMLAVAPQDVRPGPWPAGRTAPLEQLLPQVRAGSVRAVSECGVLGDPGGASAAEGERLLELLVRRLDRAARRWEAG
jgi:mycofactocin precursor peptide peptidase